MNFLLQLGLLLLVAAVLVGWSFLPPIGAVALAVIIGLLLVLTRRGRQALSVAGVGLSTLRQRLGASAVIVVGIAGVVGVLVALLAMAEGYAQTLRATGSDDTAIVLRGASAAEVMSGLSPDATKLIADAPGIVHDAKGVPVASPEIVVAANLHPRNGTPEEHGSVQMRGVGDSAWVLRPNVKIVEGRRFTPGLRELIAGKSAARQFDGLSVGSVIHLGNQPWTVVGIFASGDALDSEIWTDANMVADAYRRGASRSSVTVRLTGPSAFDTFKTSLETNPALKVEATTTATYFEKQSERMAKMIRIIGITVGLIMAIGAMFGALNTMFAAVAARSREIATLRAIGFAGLPVVVAVMLETMLLAAIGGLLGGLVAWALFDGFSASTMAGAVGKLSFELRVTPGLIWSGLKWALAIGFIGGLYPAVRAARLPITVALREA